MYEVLREFLKNDNLSYKSVVNKRRGDASWKLLVDILNLIKSNGNKELLEKITNLIKTEEERRMLKKQTKKIANYDVLYSKIVKLYKQGYSAEKIKEYILRDFGEDVPLTKIIDFIDKFFKEKLKSVREADKKILVYRRIIEMINHDKNYKEILQKFKEFDYDLHLATVINIIKWLRFFKKHQTYYDMVISKYDEKEICNNIERNHPNIRIDRRFIIALRMEGLNAEAKALQ